MAQNILPLIGKPRDSASGAATANLICSLLSANGK
jgi:hypothetical protein